MENTVRVVDQVYWVGMNDRESPLFESIWPLPNGVSYNSYLILDRKVALLDTVKKISTPNYSLVQKFCNIASKENASQLI